MNHKVVGLFAQPVTKIDSIDITGITEFFDSTIKKNADLDEVDQNGYPTHCAYPDNNLIHYHNRQNVFKIYKELENLEDQLTSAASFVYQKVLNYDSGMRITNAWFNECGVGGYQHHHNHSNCVMAGTLYLRTGSDTIIQFEKNTSTSDVTNTIIDNSNLDRENEYGYTFHYEMVSLPVNDRDCLFWPAYLKHGYPPSQTDGRLSLSFNLIPNKLTSMYLIQ